MRGLFAAVVALALTALGPAPLLAQAQGGWTGVGALLSPREFHAQLSLPAGKALSVGGVDGAGNVLATAEIRTPASGA